MRTLIMTGALLLALGVGFGAFGAHALRLRLDPAMLTVWQTAVQYHLIHALGMLVVAATALHWQGSTTGLAWSGWLLCAGIVLFSGSLYLLALTGFRWLGAVTPLGGLLLIAGWLVLAWVAFRSAWHP